MYGAGAAWSRLFLPGADPSRSEPESAPGPWPSGAGATQKSGGSATLADLDQALFEQQNASLMPDTFCKNINFCSSWSVFS